MKRCLAFCALIALTTAWISPAHAAPRHRALNRPAPIPAAPNQTNTLFNSQLNNPFNPSAENMDRRSLSQTDQATSDGLMRSGLADLQAAQSALQGGNHGAALESLRAAYDHMLAARPIYHGHRARSLQATVRAGQALDQNKPNSIKAATRQLTIAINQATIALKNW